MSNGQSKEKTQQRIDWLKANKNLWIGFPQGKYDVFYSKEFGARSISIIEKMKAVGLYSATTHNFDINLIGLINKARQQLRDNK